MGTAGLGSMKWCDNVVFVLIANMCGMERASSPPAAPGSLLLGYQNQHVSEG